MPASPVSLSPGTLLILGAGFSGQRIGDLAARQGVTVVGTVRRDDAAARLQAIGIEPLLFGAEGGRPSNETQALHAALAECTGLVVSIAPAREPPLSDAGLEALAPLPAAAMTPRLARIAPRLRWIGYLSTVGVYGGHAGAWINERTPCRPATPRSRMRLQAEREWQALGHRCAVPVSVLRLSGIYGPGRNPLAAAMHGQSRRLIKPGQVFNRIHVEDIARFTIAAMQCRYDGLLNITDHRPAPPQDVVMQAHRLCGTDPPPPIDFHTAELSPMARSFYGENKRVSNALSRSALGTEYRYPTYMEGLQALWSSGHWQDVQARATPD